MRKFTLCEIWKSVHVIFGKPKGINYYIIILRLLVKWYSFNEIFFLPLFMPQISQELAG